MGTVPVAPSTKPPIGKTLPIVLALTGAIALIGVSTAYNVMTGSGHKQEAAKSTLPARPSTADTQQVSGFEKQQALIQKSDAEHAQLQQAMAAMNAQEQGMRAQEQAMGQPIPPPRSGRNSAHDPGPERRDLRHQLECSQADIRPVRSARPGEAEGGRP